MKIFLTGCAGFIGFHISKKLLEIGFSVVGIDNLNDYYDIKLKRSRLKVLEKFNQFKFYTMNLHQLEQLKKEKFNLAINCAAQAGVRLPVENHTSYEISNVIGYRSFLEFCRKNQIKKIIYASSSSVYSCIAKMPLSEEVEITKTMSKYAETKLFNEEASSEYAYANNTKIVGLRFFTVYGEYGRPDMAYYDFTKKIYKGEEITLFNKGKTTRDMTYIDDIVDGVLASINYINNEDFYHDIFNLGNGNPVETLKLLSIIEKQIGKKAKKKFKDVKSEVACTYADLTKSKLKLNYFPKIKIEDGYKSFFSWCKQYHNL